MRVVFVMSVERNQIKYSIDTMGFFKNFFSGKSEISETDKKRSEQKNFEIFKYDGMRAQRMGRLDYAEKCYTEALKLHDDSETRSYLAQLFVQTGQLDEARRLLEQMAEAEPSHVDTLLQLANLCYMQEDYAGMADAARRAIRQEEGNAVAHFLLGKAEDGSGDSLMSVAHLTQAIVLRDDFIEARLLRAEALIKMGQGKEAQEDLAAILAQHPDHEEALLLCGRLCEQRGDCSAAEGRYTHILEQNPFNEQAYLALSALYIRQKRYSEAITLLDEAIEVNPSFSQAFHERGRAKLLNGDKEGSFVDMKQALALDPKEAERVNGHFDNQSFRQTDILGL